MAELPGNPFGVLPCPEPERRYFDCKIDKLAEYVVDEDSISP